MRNLVLSLALALTSVSAHAVPVLYDFAGALSFIRDTDDLVTEFFALGDSFTGTVSYESDAPNESLDPDDHFSSRAAITAMTVQLNGFLFTSTSSGSIFMGGDSNVLSLRAPSESDPVIESLDPPSTSIQTLFFGGPEFVFDTDSLPTSLDLSDFSRGQMELFGANNVTDSHFSIHGIITSLTAVSLPEPGTLGLLGFGLVGAGLVRQRKLA